MKNINVKLLEIVPDNKEEMPSGKLKRVLVEIDGRKLFFWTTESNIEALEFDFNQKGKE